MRQGPSLTAKVSVVLLLLIAIIAVAMMKEKDGGSPTVAGQRAPGGEALGVPRMLELGSVSCIPCKMMKPVMEELQKEYGPNLRVDFIDVWQDPDEGRKYGIESIPTQILYDTNGNEIYRHVGFWPKDEIANAFREHGVDLRKQ